MYTSRTEYKHEKTSRVKYLFILYCRAQKSVLICEYKNTFYSPYLYPLLDIQSYFLSKKSWRTGQVKAEMILSLFAH